MHKWKYDDEIITFLILFHIKTKSRDCRLDIKKVLYNTYEDNLEHLFEICINLKNNLISNEI